MSATHSPKKNVGVWFYGLSGCGKTYASNFFSKNVDKPFLIDGDLVRKHVSPDLGYSEPERKIQIGRIFGIGAIAIENGMFPIISSVTMTGHLLEKCIATNISVIRIERPIDQMKSVRSLYFEQKNVVGVDLKLPDLDVFSIRNNGTEDFERELYEYAKYIAI